MKNYNFLSQSGRHIYTGWIKIFLMLILSNKTVNIENEGEREAYLTGINKRKLHEINGRKMSS